jgi:hypothetical protein
MLAMSRARLLVVPLLTCACHTMSTVPMSPNTSGPLPRHSTVVLTRGDRVPVDDGRTTRDSLIGVRFDGARFAVHRDSVSFVETRKVSVVRSVGAGVGGMLVALSVLTVVAIGAALGEMQ